MKRKAHLINWKAASHSIQLGGVAIGDFRNGNTSAIAKMVLEVLY